MKLLKPNMLIIRIVPTRYTYWKLLDFSKYVDKNPFLDYLANPKDMVKKRMYSKYEKVRLKKQDFNELNTHLRNCITQWVYDNKLKGMMVEDETNKEDMESG